MGRISRGWITAAAGATVALLACGRTDDLVGRKALGSLVVQDGCVDFGSVRPGTSVERTVLLRNGGKAPLPLERATIAPLSADWEIRSVLPAALPPDDPGTPDDESAFELVVAFSPGRAARYDADLELRSGDPKHPLRRICLDGWGEGPEIVCDPGEVVFAATPIGYERTRMLRCRNDAFGGAPSHRNRVLLDRVAVDGSQFTATALQPSGERLPPGAEIWAGESFDVRVVYAPAGPEAAATLEFFADDLSGPVGSVPLSGTGWAGEPCDLDVWPSPIDFGVVRPGKRGQAVLYLRNAGENACMIWDLEATDGTAPEFAFEYVEALVLEPGGELKLPVVFAPTDERFLFEGGIRFNVSDPSQMERLVPLTARSRGLCAAFSLRELDFGAVEPGCSSSVRTVRLHNVCDEPIEVSALDTEGENRSAFSFRDKPAMPLSIAPRSSVPFDLSFDPANEATYEARLTAEVDVGDQKLLLPLRGEARAGALQELRYEQKMFARVDLLWVIDNSASMDPFQERVASGLQPFLTLARDRAIDFQMGVTTTGLEEGFSNLVCPGGVDGAEDGRLFPVDGSSPRILSSGTSSLETHWAKNIQVGICNGSEKGLEAAWRALSPPLIDSADDPRHPEPDDGNLGLLRDDTHVAVIFLTDEEDHSGLDVRQYLDRFASVRGPDRPELFSAHGIIGDPEKGCVVDGTIARASTRYGALIAETSGTWQSICTADWTSALRRIGDAAFGLRTRFPLGNDCRDVDGDGTLGAAELFVFVDGVEVPATDGVGQQRWRYLADERSVELLEPFVPPVGAEVTLVCQPACG